MGEATEVALRVLAEKVGLPGYADMPGALANLSKRERATFCNDHWQEENHRVSLGLPHPPDGPLHGCQSKHAKSRTHMLSQDVATPGLYAQLHME